MAHVTARDEAYRKGHPAATWADFFRAEPLVIRLYAEKMEREYRPPALYTPEGHPVLFGRLRYAVRDQEQQMPGLLAAADFEETTAPEDPVGTRHFAWLRTGPAERYVQESAKPDHGMMITGQRFEEQFRTESRASLRALIQKISAEAYPKTEQSEIDARVEDAMSGTRAAEAADAQELVDWMKQTYQIDVDVAKPLAWSLDLELRIVSVPASQAVSALSSGSVDA